MLSREVQSPNSSDQPLSRETPSPYSRDQLTAWLRGLLTLAWADGHFDEEEKQLISSITETDLAPSINLDNFEPIAAADLAQALGPDPKIHNNFLRTAVMVALADGVYSTPEDELLHQFCTALSLEDAVLQSLRSTLYDPASQSVAPHGCATTATPLPPPAADATDGPASHYLATAVAGSLSDPHGHPHGIDVLHPAREWLDGLEIHDPQLARFLCKLVPPQCPFERDISLFGHKVVHIPPLCKLNPLYEQLVGLRFRALCYLADECGEDIRPYC